MSAKPNHFIPKDHKLNQYFARAALNMPGSSEAGVANASFNVTPIKTRFASPSDALSTLESKVIVIHGSKDTISPWQIVEVSIILLPFIGICIDVSVTHSLIYFVQPLTRLAIAEQWAPTGKLSFYNDHEGHMSLIDSPYVLAKAYRKAAVEERVLVGSFPA